MDDDDDDDDNKGMERMGSKAEGEKMSALRKLIDLCGPESDLVL